MGEPYRASWNSLRRHATAEWFRDAKFGIYTHWGVYSVPACGPNASWYPYNMYREGTPQHEHHVKVYGGPAKFGYKDFIPLFTGERFDPDEWAEMFRRAGAKFAGPVGEHHDGFCMWDTSLSEWSAARMGPKRDVVGELEKSVRRAGMKFMVALHHAENWWFYPHWRKDFDTSDPRYAGLYGEPHDVDGPPAAPPGEDPFFHQARASRAFLDTWKAKIVEVVDRYQPDLLWFDFGLGRIPEPYQQEALAHYYNRAAERGREVAVTYKYHDLPPNTALVDIELGREEGLTYHEWLTDSTVDDGEGWGYVADARYKTAGSLVHYLIDNVSRNGHLLLNVGPRPDGTFPDEAKRILEGIGRWLDVNGEAIYATTPWVKAGEGPTKPAKSGPFTERQALSYTAEDIRFTVKDDALYAIVMAWPSRSVVIRSLTGAEDVKSVAMLGSEKPLEWTPTGDGLHVTFPTRRPCDHAYVLKIVRGR